MTTLLDKQFKSIQAIVYSGVQRQWQRRVLMLSSICNERLNRSADRVIVNTTMYRREVVMWEMDVMDETRFVEVMGNDVKTGVRSKWAA